MPNSLLPPICPSARRRAASGHPVSLLVWHDFVPTPANKLVWFDTPVALFDAQLAKLERADARPMGLPALYDYLSRDGATVPPPGACVLCFDDNTAGIVEYAVPRLQKRGWPFALSAHTKYVGVTTSKVHNDWDTLRQVEAAMGGTVVCQTHTHPPDLRTFRDTALNRELTTARAIMERELRHPIRFLTYPSGKWDTRVALAAARAGFRMALTEDYGPAETSPHLLGIHRYSTHRRWDEGLAAVARAAR